MSETKRMYPNADIAFMRFSQLLSQKGFINPTRIPKNRFRHNLIKTQNLDFYCLYRDSEPQYGTFEKFNDYFPEFILEYPEYKGHAESINKEIIQSLYDDYEGQEKEVILVFIYKDGHIYLAYPFQFKRFAEKHKLIRVHKTMDLKPSNNGNKIAINETTYHLPFKEQFFTNFDEWIEKNKPKIQIINWPPFISYGKKRLVTYYWNSKKK